MGAAASAQFGPTLDAEAIKPVDGSDLVDYNAARAEAGDRILAQRQQRTREQQQVGLDEEMEPQTELGEQMFPSPAPAETA